MKQKPKVIILHGHPCTGKSSLAKQLAIKLHCPILARDEIKELLFDQLGIRDREWSMALGKASYSIFLTIRKTTENEG